MSHIRINNESRTEAHLNPRSTHINWVLQTKCVTSCVLRLCVIWCSCVTWCVRDTFQLMWCVICHMMCSWHISIDVTEMMCSYVTWCVRDTFQFIFLYTTWTETHLNSRVTAAHSIDVMCHTSNDVFVTHSNSYSYVRHELKRTLPRKSWPQLWTSHVTHLNENRVTNWNAP